jgi:endonuclease/exonuclease/phosphatase (EEP) superfamily protein YafD
MPLSRFDSPPGARCRRRRRDHVARTLLAALALTLAAGCVTLTEAPRALVREPNGISVATLACPAAQERARRAAVPGDTAALDPEAIRIVTWNLHKQSDAGWERDLTFLSHGTDVLLLQEVTLNDALQEILDNAQLGWVMASSFLYADIDTGVLTATRVAPVASCTLRAWEPLLRLPKSAVIDWLPLAGTSRTLAVANVHAINFALSLDAYRAQLDAMADALAGHDGPMIFGGDLNTWSAARQAVVRDVAARLGLTEVAYASDDRTLFFGQQLDHLLVRGLDVAASGAYRVRSSDHNPVDAVVRLAR